MYFGDKKLRVYFADKSTHFHSPLGICQALPSTCALSYVIPNPFYADHPWLPFLRCPMRRSCYSQRAGSNSDANSLLHGSSLRAFQQFRCDPDLLPTHPALFIADCHATCRIRQFRFPFDQSRGAARRSTPCGSNSSSSPSESGQLGRVRKSARLVHSIGDCPRGCPEPEGLGRSSELQGGERQ